RVVSIFFFQAEDGIRDDLVTGVQTCALPISPLAARGADGLGARRQTPRFREGAGGARGSGRAPRARRPAARRGAEDFRARRGPHPSLSGLAPGRAAESRDPPEEERPGADRTVRGADRRDGGPPGG